MALSKFTIPQGTRAVVYATDIETAGETPLIDALMAVGVVVLLIGAPGEPPAIFYTQQWNCFRAGTKRFSARCAKQYLTHANDESADRAYWTARRAASEASDYADLHTYPRVAPFAYESGPRCTHEGDGEEHGCVACHNERALEHRAYEEWHALRRAVYEAAIEAGAEFKQVTDNGGFDHGWLLALSAAVGACPPNYLYRDFNGDCVVYMPMQETDLQLKSFIEGFCLGRGVTPPKTWWNANTLLLLALEDLSRVAKLQCPVEHNHMPCDDATVIAWTYAICWCLAQGDFATK